MFGLANSALHLIQKRSQTMFQPKGTLSTLTPKLCIKVIRSSIIDFCQPWLSATVYLVFPDTNVSPRIIRNTHDTKIKISLFDTSNLTNLQALKMNSQFKAIKPPAEMRTHPSKNLSFSREITI